MTSPVHSNLKITSDLNNPVDKVSQKTESGVEILDQENLGRVYTVLELAGVLKVKSVPVARESSKALFLGDSLLTPASNQPKRLLIKGYDMIARNEKEAVEQYIQFLKEKLIELDKTKITTRELLGSAEKFYQEMI